LRRYSDVTARSILDVVGAGVPREEQIRHALEESYGNVTWAAVRLGITRATLWYHLRSHEMRAVPREIRARLRDQFRVD